MRRFWAIVILASVISAAAASCSKDTASGQSVPEGPGEQGLEQISFIAGRQGITGTKAGESGAVFSLGEACTQDGAGEGAGQSPPDAQAAAGTQNEAEAGSAQSSTAEPQTKSRFDTSTAIHWTENEELVVYDDVLGDAHTFHAASAGASSPIIGSVCVGAHTYWSVSPASAAVSFNRSTQTAVVSVPSSQTLSGTAQYASDPAAMVAVAKIVRNSDGSMPEGGVEYNNICGFIRFKFSASVTQLTLRSLNGSLLAGNVQVNMSGASPSPGSVNFGSESVTVRADSEGNPFTLNREYTVPVLVGSGLSGVNFSYLEGDTEYYGRATFTDPLLPGCGQQLGDLHGKGSSGVSGFTATPVSTSSIRLDWNNMNIPGATVKYEIRRTSADINYPDDPSKVVVASNLSAATVNADGLDDGTAYRFYIRAYDGTGTPVSGWGRTTQMSKILQPASVIVTGTKANELSVAFTEPRGADRYTITVTGSTGSLPATISASPVTVTGATRNTTGISVTVVARNSVYTHTGVNSDAQSGTGRTGYFSGGAGTESSPYLISCEDDIRDLITVTGETYTASLTENPASGTNAGSTATAFRSSYYNQTADISGTSGSYMTFTDYIGTRETYPFRGVYDGQNHTVSYYDITNTNYVGLFGAVVGGTVKNLNCSYFRPHHTGADMKYQGAVVGDLNAGTIDNCHYLEGPITFTTGVCGGVVGRVVEGSTVTNCTTRASITGGGDDCGGVVGYANNSTISNCCAFGTAAAPITVSSPHNCTGGVIGLAREGAIIQNCWAENINVITPADPGTDINIAVGGIAGHIQFATINSCTFRKGTVEYSGTTQKGGVGGISGKMKGGTISNCRVCSTGDVTLRCNGDMTGGIVGDVYVQEDGGNAEIISCAVSSESDPAREVRIEGRSFVGGIVGNFEPANPSGPRVALLIKDCCFKGGTNGAKINAVGTGVGGIMGGIRPLSKIVAAAQPYILRIKHCYIQNTPELNAGNDAAYGSGISPILGYASIFASNTEIRIFNNIVGSARLYDAMEGGIHMGGMIGYVRGNLGNNVFTIRILNNASYVSGYYADHYGSYKVCVGSAIGYVNTNDMADDIGYIRIHALATDFTYNMVYSSEPPAKAAMFSGVPALSDATGLVVGYLPSNFTTNAGGTKYNNVTIDNIVGPISNWTNSSNVTVYNNRALVNSNVTKTQPYSKTKRATEPEYWSTTCANNCIDFLNGVTKKTEEGGSNRKGVSWSSDYQKVFTAMRWVYKNYGDDNRPYIDRTPVSYLWDPVADADD